MHQSARQPLSWAARTSKNVLTFRMCLLVKNFPESDDGSFIQMSLISTDLEVQGTTLQLFDIYLIAPSQKYQRQFPSYYNQWYSLQLKPERPTSERQDLSSSRRTSDRSPWLQFNKYKTYLNVKIMAMFDIFGRVIPRPFYILQLSKKQVVSIFFLIIPILLILLTKNLVF